MLHFTKMHGIGNDYIYINCFREKVEFPEQLAILLSDRHFGAGADGLVLIMPSDKADFRMRMFNADGSEGNMCGNASRCVAKYVYDCGLTGKTAFTLETKSGIKALKVLPDNGKAVSVTVDMGKAILEPKLIPVIAEGENFISRPVNVGGREYSLTCVSMGNPHAVLFTEEIDKLELEKIGPSFERHPLFPERINTEFCEICDDSSLRMRVWERGSGETMACGTGACASVMAGILNGYFQEEKEITVHLRGGDLSILCKEDGTILMTGSASHVYDASVNIEELLAPPAQF